VREDLESQVEAEARREVNNEIINQVVSRNSFELPPSLIRDYLERLTEDLKRNQPQITAEEVEARYKDMGTRQVRWEFLYHAIADKESVRVTEEEIGQWVERYAAAQGLDLDQVREQLSGSSQVARIRDNILENKVLALLRDRSTITELPVAGGGLIATPGGGTSG
jgi:FKBP-type peptidyl-prolyl cis-trans isomerase (trigger factor)